MGYVVKEGSLGYPQPTSLNHSVPSLIMGPTSVYAIPLARTFLLNIRDGLSNKYMQHVVYSENKTDIIKNETNWVKLSSLGNGNKQTEINQAEEHKLLIRMPRTYIYASIFSNHESTCCSKQDNQFNKIKYSLNFKVTIRPWLCVIKTEFNL